MLNSAWEGLAYRHLVFPLSPRPPHGKKPVPAGVHRFRLPLPPESAHHTYAQSLGLIELSDRNAQRRDGKFELEVPTVTLFHDCTCREN